MPKVHVSILPDGLYETLTAIGAGLRHGRDIGADVTRAQPLVAGLPAATIAQAERVVGWSLGEHLLHAPTSLAALLAGRHSVRRQLQQDERLAYLLLFHRSGHLRQAALDRLQDGLPTPFLFVAVAWRLNDWAEPVRHAAALCAARTFPVTEDVVVAEAAMTLLPRELSWRRWGDERRPLDEAFDRPGVAERLANLIRQQRTGPAATVLTHALRRGAIDPHLERLACSALQPAVRVVAIRTLVEGCASWPIGFEWHWVDKRYGLRRRERAFAHRPIALSAALDQAVRWGVADRAAVVRKAALDGLIGHQAEIADAHAIAASLANDRHPAVRERVAFILKRSIPKSLGP